MSFRARGEAPAVIDRDLGSPGAGEVLLRVEACGVCHSDLFVREGTFPGVAYPRVPGHEVAGVVEAVGPGVEGFRAGDRAGVGWYGGHCSTCEPCRRGDFVLCRRGEITGITRDGGYATHLLARAQALVRIPAAIAPAEAAPLLCAGITTFNALRHSHARPGDRVAVQGVGGLGHLAVQFAAKMGFETIAIARGAERADLARRLGAAQYVDSAASDPAKALADRGGANVILATAPDAKSMSALVDGLAPDGELIVVGASADPIQVSPLQLIAQRRTVRGWPSGSAIDSEDTLRFAALAGVRPMVETYPFARAAEAFERGVTGAARFRAVIEPGR